MNDENLNGGVLIIGSLLWQDHLSEKGDDIRKKWRKDHLDASADIYVQVPIRYGRRSRGGVYTMTFANSVRQALGIGVVRSFAANPIQGLDALKKETKALSVAEGMEGQFIKNDKQNMPWSVLAILLNRRIVTNQQREDLLNWWLTQLQAEKTYPNFQAENFRLGNEEPCIEQNGSLNIPWIKSIDPAKQEILDQHHFLIATATLPTGTNYPDVATMRTSVQEDTERQYFLNNYKHGIRTFQDEEIVNEIRGSKDFG
ncbi:MAG: hypothetical protein WCF67_17285 [Chitinophagaceae bacterium]